MSSTPGPSTPGGPWLSMHEKWTELAGGRLHYLLGDAAGPEVVFLPGGALDSSTLTWKKVARSLPRGYRIYVLDLPGNGGSELPYGAEASTESYAAFVRTFFERHGISDAVLLGASVGGAVALRLAAPAVSNSRGKALVRALVLSGSHGLHGRVPFHEATYLVSRAAWLRPARSLLRRRIPARLALRLVIHDAACIDEELVEDVLREARRPRAMQAFSAWLRHELRPRSVASDFRERLKSIDVPVLLLQGRYDWLVPEPVARAAAQRIRNAELRVLTAGHMVARERPQESVRIVKDFLARVAPLG